MRKRYPTVHSFVIAPETLEWIHSECVCESNDDRKCCKNSENPGFSGSIFRFNECKGKPSSCNYLDYDAKGEIFSGDVWKEEIIRDYKYNKRKRKDAKDDDHA